MWGMCTLLSIQGLCAQGMHQLIGSLCHLQEPRALWAYVLCALAVPSGAQQTPHVPTLTPCSRNTVSRSGPSHKSRIVANELLSISRISSRPTMLGCRRPCTGGQGGWVGRWAGLMVEEHSTQSTHVPTPTVLIFTP